VNVVTGKFVAALEKCMKGLRANAWKTLRIGKEAKGTRECTFFTLTRLEAPALI
jgi:hypothetical protein